MPNYIKKYHKYKHKFLTAQGGSKSQLKVSAKIWTPPKPPVPHKIKFVQQNIGPQAVYGTGTDEFGWIREPLSTYNNLVKNYIPGTWATFTRYRNVINYLNSQDPEKLADIYTLQEVQEEGYSCSCPGQRYTDPQDTCACEENKEYYHESSKDELANYQIVKPIDVTTDSGVRYLGYYVRTGHLVYADQESQARKIFHGCVVIYNINNYRCEDDCLTRHHRAGSKLESRSTPWLRLTNIETGCSYMVISLHGKIASNVKNLQIVEEISKHLIHEIQYHYRNGNNNIIIGTDLNFNILSPPLIPDGQLMQDINSVYESFLGQLAGLGIFSIYNSIAIDTSFYTNYELRDGITPQRECVDYVFTNLDVEVINMSALLEYETLASLEYFTWSVNDYDHKQVEVGLLDNRF